MPRLQHAKCRAPMTAHIGLGTGLDLGSVLVYTVVLPDGMLIQQMLT